MFRNFKRTVAALLAAVLFASSVSPAAYAEAPKIPTATAAESVDGPSLLVKYGELDREATMTMGEFLTAACDLFGAFERVPKSSAYVRLEYRNVFPGSPLHKALQKGVYLDVVENVPAFLPLKKKATEAMFAKMIERLTGQKIEVPAGKLLTYGALVDTFLDLYSPTDENGGEQSRPDSIAGGAGFDVLDSTYLHLRDEYYDASKSDPQALIRGAVKGMAESVDDPYTVYFPPTESQAFQDELAGSFEGIGAYVDMEVPGVLKIVSPFPNSPAEKAGLRGGDVVTKIDGFVIDDKISLQEAIAKIKGPAGSEVTLTVKRGAETLSVKIKRERIEIKYVEYRKLPSGVPYLKIGMFGDGTLAAFDEAAKWIDKNGTDTDKLIIDLRNNPGGNLDEVAGILSYFVPKGEPVVKIRLRNSKDEMVSAGTESKIGGRKIAILINGGSASASEIMAGTIKDYLPKTVLVGEKSYGKGSVQSVMPFADGSSLKYTIAKWFTGKTETGIDHVGISPDVTSSSSTGATFDASSADEGVAAAEKALRNIR